MTATQRPEFRRRVQADGIELVKARKKVGTDMAYDQSIIWHNRYVGSRGKGTCGLWERKAGSA